jgi:hypothetical protein
VGAGVKFRGQWRGTSLQSVERAGWLRENLYFGKRVPVRVMSLRGNRFRATVGGGLILAASACGGASSDGLLGGGGIASGPEPDADSQGSSEDATAKKPPEADAAREEAQPGDEPPPTEDAASAEDSPSEDAGGGAEPASPCATAAPCNLGSACCTKAGAVMYGQCYVLLFPFDCN